MYCRNCGKKLKENSCYCANCGVKVRKTKDENLVENLVIQFQSGKQEVFEELYLQTQQYVRYFASQFFKNDSSKVEDVVQEVYIVIYRKISTLKDPSAAWGWIKTVTRNTAISMLEKEDKYVLMQEEEEYVFDNIEETDTFSLPETMVDEKETKELLGEMINELPSLQKIILLEHYYNERKIAEIADAYDMVESTVKVYLMRARKALAEKVSIYQRRTGVQLRSAPAAPIFYMVFWSEIQSTVGSLKIPKTILRATGAVGASKLGVTKEIEKKKSVTAAKMTAKKTVAGIAATAMVGTGVVHVSMNHQDGERKIIQVVEDFEDACQQLDNEAAKECLTKESKDALMHADLMKEYVASEKQELHIQDETNMDLQVQNVQIEENEARAYCIYIRTDETGNEKVQEGYLGFLYEEGKWKIELCRASCRMFKQGTMEKNTRFPELIQNELVYNDELDK